ncbi:hypothetical protein [Sphingomonas sp. PAMC 26617]|uniref:hypothetical protein n=1 Tax=Sphingomonas sp. PAMC 26617 TaxID=1112216 RepID=UPI0002887E3D|nr:hypothetical protein [Sphingomonas sp. PAMC 26617]
MGKLLFPLIVLLLGAAVGGASAFGVRTLFFPAAAAGKAKPAADVETTLVPLPRMTAPLVLPDGRLSGYAAFEEQLEVPAAEAARVTARLPYLQHAINMRTYRIPLAAGRDGALPDIDVFRRVTLEAATEAFGRGVVRRVAVTQAVPA